MNDRIAWIGMGDLKVRFIYLVITKIKSSHPRHNLALQILLVAKPVECYRNYMSLRE